MFFLNALLFFEDQENIAIINKISYAADQCCPINTITGYKKIVGYQYKNKRQKRSRDIHSYPVLTREICGIRIQS